MTRLRLSKCDQIISLISSVSKVFFISFNVGQRNFFPTARRPRSWVTTPEENERILRAPAETRFTTATAIREALHLQVSATTVRRRLHEAGLHHRVPARKERLTAAHRAGRLDFANQHIGHDLNFWSRAVFTDEKTFSSFNHGRLHVWRENNTR